MPQVPRHPDFSLIIPTFRSVTTLATTIMSLLEQDHDSFEVIVVDGESDDGTADLARELLADLPAGRTATVVSERDAGVYDAMNKGLRMAQGRILYFIGAGDRMRPGILSSVDPLMAPGANDRPVFLYGQAFIVRWNGVMGGPVGSRPGNRRGEICHQAIFYDRRCFDLVGEYDLAFPVYGDWQLNLRCFAEPGIETRYVDLVMADFEGGGLSDFVADPGIMRDLPVLLTAAFGSPDGASDPVGIEADASTVVELDLVPGSGQNTGLLVRATVAVDAPTAIERIEITSGSGFPAIVELGATNHADRSSTEYPADERLVPTGSVSVTRELWVDSLAPGAHEVVARAWTASGSFGEARASVNIDGALANRQWVARADRPTVHLLRADPSIALTPLTVVVLPGDRTGYDVTLASLSRQEWPATEVRIGWTDAKMVSGLVVLVDAGTHVHPDALAEVRAHRAAMPGVDLLTADHLALDVDGGIESIELTPGWSPETLVCSDYLGGMVALASRVVGPGQPESAWDAAVAAVDRIEAGVRIPRVLSRRPKRARPAPMRSLERIASDRGCRLQLHGALEDSVFDVRIIPRRMPALSLVVRVTTGGRSADERIRALAGAVPDAEVVVVDTTGTIGSVENVRHIVPPAKSSYARIANMGAAAATADVLCFVDEWTLIPDPAALQLLAAHVQTRGVGIAGGLVHAEFGAPTAFVMSRGALIDADEAAGRSAAWRRWVARSVVAVLGPGLTVRREVLEHAGGFSEEVLPGQVEMELCLRLRTRGLRIVSDPRAVLGTAAGVGRRPSWYPADHVELMASDAADGSIDAGYHPLLGDDPFVRIDPHWLLIDDQVKNAVP